MLNEKVITIRANCFVTLGNKTSELTCQ